MRQNLLCNSKMRAREVQSILLPGKSEGDNCRNRIRPVDSGIRAVDRITVYKCIIIQARLNLSVQTQVIICTGGYYLKLAANPVWITSVVLFLLLFWTGALQYI